MPGKKLFECYIKTLRHWRGGTGRPTATRKRINRSPTFLKADFHSLLVDYGLAGPLEGDVLALLLSLQLYSVKLDFPGRDWSSRTNPALLSLTCQLYSR